MGGGGWHAGVVDQLCFPAIVDRYAAASTNGGHNAIEVTAAIGACDALDDVENFIMDAYRMSDICI